MFTLWQQTLSDEVAWHVSKHRCDLTYHDVGFILSLLFVSWADGQSSLQLMCWFVELGWSKVFSSMTSWAAMVWCRSTACSSRQDQCNRQAVASELSACLTVSIPTGMLTLQQPITSCSTLSYICRLQRCGISTLTVCPEFTCNCNHVVLTVSSCNACKAHKLCL